MLILFDIDGTLLVTGGAGIDAMADAGRALFGDHFTIDGIEFAGRLDPLIWADAAKLNALVGDDREMHERFRAGYRAALERRLANGAEVRALPGVIPLLERLQTMDSLALGVLTGNYPETGRMKMRAAGIDSELFTINAFGSDGAHRRELPPKAIERYAQCRGRPIEATEVVIIGDTPHDIDCAHHNRCRCLAVATGRSCAADLRACAADLVVDDLSAVDEIVAWITSATPAR